MPGDNTATIASGAPMIFPQNGPASGGVTRSLTTPTSAFVLAAVGVYWVQFQVSVNEPGQLMLTLGGTALTNTAVGRATGTSQIVGTSLVMTSVPSQELRLVNPAGSVEALTITPIAGGTHSVSAHLVIMQIQ
eukprot:TRINITY_DN22194_c0_g1_i1.p1 TRINITY_DN22194_c0_g1~~TRINITY_DN22194_c0_g1_i1.p1  ORF type:complete len:133 (+),score=6.97 TRINITY_DN22194_c0_g1_i1:101-499(+)